MSIEMRDPSALRIRLMEASHEARRSENRDARALRDETRTREEHRVALEAQAEQKLIRSKGWKSVGEGSALAIRIVGLVLAPFTFGISALIGGIASEGTKLGVSEARKKEDRLAADLRREAGHLASDAVIAGARAERQEDSADAERDLAKSLGANQERIQREFRRAFGLS
jgi:hypothetical protein